MPSELKSFNIKMPFDSTIGMHLFPKFLAPWEFTLDIIDQT
jgi:hypothetical protein